MPSKKFVRILDGVKITVIVEKTKETPADILDGKPTKKTEKMDLGWVLSKFFGLEYTYSQATWYKMMERRKLFCKKQFDEANFTKEEGILLADLTTELSDYFWRGESDTLYTELYHELIQFRDLEAAQKRSMLTEAEKAERLEKAKQILKELRQKRGLE